MSYTPAELHAQFTRVTERLQQAGWLRWAKFTEGKGWHLVWTEEGGLKAALLKDICRRAELVDGDAVPLAFDVAAHGGGLPPGADVPDVFFEFWRTEVDPLGLQGDEDGLICLVHMICTWAPDEGTPKISSN
jgi:hypothetical protein